MFYMFFVAFICFALEYDAVNLEVEVDDQDEAFQGEDIKYWYRP